MRLELFFLLLQFIRSLGKQYFITYNRSACSLPGATCDGSQAKPYSPPTSAFRSALSDERVSFTGSLEFLFEAGSHAILPSEFPDVSSDVYVNSIFKTYLG